jgi:tetratricopeptide (TPR) repeat protein
LKSYEQSLRDFEVLLDENDRNARAHFYKGKILKKQGMENESVLHFEQVIKNTNNPQLATSPHRLSQVNNNGD